MREYVSKKREIFASKIEKLIDQFNFLLVEDFPFGDTHIAIKTLKHQASRLRKRLDDYESYSPTIRTSIAKHVNYTLNYSSEILGILARSATTRNAFELYQPFKDELRPFFEDQIYLIMSSEWSYVPFTYPMNLQELPDFIIIGLPATESNNVLIFPSAAHELGHSIWLKSNIAEILSKEVSSAIKKSIEENNRLIESIIPKGLADGENNLFSQEMKRQFVINGTESCLRQLEEIFCDFIGLGIYGKAYLYAFAYLIAPSDGGPRSVHYPDTKARANLLSEYGKKYGVDLIGYGEEFAADQPPRTLMNKWS